MRVVYCSRWSLLWKWKTFARIKWTIRLFYFQNQRFRYFLIFVFLFLYLLSKINPLPLWSYLSFVKPAPQGDGARMLFTFTWIWNVVQIVQLPSKKLRSFVVDATLMLRWFMVSCCSSIIHVLSLSLMGIQDEEQEREEERFMMA